METVKLKVSKRIYSKFLSIISQFNPKDLQIVNVDDEIKSYLENQLDHLNSKEAEFLTVDELDSALEKVISKYED